MKKLTLCLAAAVFMFSAGIASAACTPEELQAKATTVATQLQTLAQKDAAKFQQVVQDFQQKSTELSQKGDMDELCKYYDEMIEATK